jgi:amidohydrolase
MPARSSGTALEATPHPLLAAARELADRLVAWRRDFHRHPEIGYTEARTPAIVAEHLRSLGLDVRTGVGRTGVLGLILGRAETPCVLLRADMDALPIEEAADVPYRSTVPGVMHACGHDAHTAILMGVACVLAERAGELPGSVKLAFQPAEENGAGALAMCDDGAVVDPPIRAAAALHTDSDVPAGAIRVRPGPITAFTDGVTIRVRGHSAHAAAPHTGVDTVVVAAEVLLSLQAMIAREVDPLRQRVLSFGMVHGGTAENVVADETVLRGTLRTFDLATRRHAFSRIRRHAVQVARAHGATAEVELAEGYPPQVNDAKLTDLIIDCGRELLGRRGVLPPGDPSLGGEDFPYFGRAAKVPSVMFELGIKGDGKPTIPHSPAYRFDELPALPTGVAVLSHFAMRCLAKLAR